MLQQREKLSQKESVSLFLREASLRGCSHTELNGGGGGAGVLGRERAADRAPEAPVASQETVR